LENGKIAFEGGTDESVSFYLSKEKEKDNLHFPLLFNEGEIVDFKILDFIGNNSSLLLGEKCSFVLQLKIQNPKKLKLNIRYQIFDKNDKLITTLNTFHLNANKRLKSNFQNFTCEIANLRISPDLYFLAIQILDIQSKKILYENSNFTNFKVESGDIFSTGKLPSRENIGVFLSDQNWQIK
jgi:lipopolysaccharide transport system ATP-binding protein